MIPGVTSVEWLRWPKAAKRQYAVELIDMLNGEFTLLGVAHPAGLPVFHHSTSHINFVLVPSGECLFGLTEDHEKLARTIKEPLPITINELRPVQNRNVKMFLISATPILWRTCTELSSGLYPPLQAGDSSAAFLERRQWMEMATRLGCRLPTEVEWEYACRANAATLFPWGDILPERSILAKWLSLDFSTLADLASNDFGLFGLFTGEWCLDQYKESHASDAKGVSGAYVVKGGGALFWPWQDDEWVWCIPAMRMPSTDLIDNTCGCRFVFPIPGKSK
jgi:formylglycine-generating enzyme